MLVANASEDPDFDQISDEVIVRDRAWDLLSMYSKIVLQFG